MHSYWIIFDDSCSYGEWNTPVASYKWHSGYISEYTELTNENLLTLAII